VCFETVRTSRSATTLSACCCSRLDASFTNTSAQAEESKQLDLGFRKLSCVASPPTTMNALSRREVGCKHLSRCLLRESCAELCALPSLLQEETILKDLKKQALKQCDDYVRGRDAVNMNITYTSPLTTIPTLLLIITTDFAACSQGRTISVVWSCGKQWRAMQGCMRVQWV
jgi:hypothetical protein